MILYFSGTGNSKYLAESIADKTKDNIISINTCIKENKQININDDKLVICAPTYAWRIPKVVLEWLLKNNYKENIKVYFVMSCGSDIGNADKYNRELSNQLNLNYMGTEYVALPENYIAMFNSPSIEEEKEIIEKAKPIIEDIINTIINNESFKQHKVNIFDSLKSGITNSFFYNVYVNDKKFYTTNDCIGCGLCEKLCPLNNIKIINKKVIWNNNCTQCMACISYCPKEAIEYGNLSKGKRRYYFGKEK